jgi:hypothetical protein
VMPRGSPILGDKSFKGKSLVIWRLEFFWLCFKSANFFWFCP